MRLFHTVVLLKMARDCCRVRAARAARPFSSFDQSHAYFVALSFPLSSSIGSFRNDDGNGNDFATDK